MPNFDEITHYLSKLNLTKKKILSVGSGDALFEKHLIQNKIASNIECIDKREIGNDVIEADFLQYKFKKKFDMLFFIHSIQFIIGEKYADIDKNYFKFIEKKIRDILKINGHIFIKLVKKEWFIKNKKTSKKFLQTLDNTYENILKMKFNIIYITETKDEIFMLLQI
jgi:hypothetical protein